MALVLSGAAYIGVRTLPVATGGDEAEVQTNRSDYAPGDTAFIVGSGFWANETVTLQVTPSDGTPDGGGVHEPWDVTADSSGTIHASWAVDPVDPADSIFVLTADGQDSNQHAETTFAEMSIGTYDQCSNDLGTGYSSGDTGCRWINGNLQSNNSIYKEGDATIQRVWMDQLVPGSTHTITLKYGTTKGSKHAYDFLTTWDWSETWSSDADRCQDITGCTSATDTYYDIPQDPNVPDSFEPSAPGDRQFTMRGATPGASTTPLVVSGTYAGDSETVITLTFTVDSSGPMCTTSGPDAPMCGVALWFGAHVAAQANWGLGLGAGSISGSPYHVALDAVDGASVGQRDNQMQAGVVTVIPNGTIVIIKDAVPDDSQDFSFNLNNASTISQSFLLDDDAQNGLSDLLNSQTFSVPPGVWTATELNIPVGWNLTGLSCSDPSNNTTTDLSTGIASIDLSSSETVTCTYTDTKLCEQTCNDDNPCTDDTCDIATGECVYTNDDENACTDGSACTTDECVAGVCTPTPVVCDDGQFCTIDSCDNETGCTTAPNDCGELVCNEGNNTCVECNVDADCPGDEPFCTDGNTCVECVIDGDCNDGNACTTDACTNGTCGQTPVVCDDGQFCTIDSCDNETGCTTAPNDCGELVCNEGNNTCVECNVDADCPGDEPFCTDGNTCVECVIDGDCNDGNACTTDACTNGTCGQTPVVCDDGQFCTIDSCDNETGCTTAPNDCGELVCNEGNNTCVECNADADCPGDEPICTDGNACVECVIDGDCNDGNACTTDACTNGTCGQTPVVCDDGQFCTIDSCDNETGCTTAPNDCGELVCNEDGNTCVECNADADCPGDEPFCTDGNTCVECVIDGDCNDGNACTTDACTNGTCGQTPVVCDDGQFCTIDSCDNETGCTTAPNDCGELVCNEGNNTCVECNADADCPGDEPICTDGNACVECVIDGDCNDGNACTTDACTNGTCGQTPVVCDDGQFCTIDSCDNETGCTTAPNDCGELVCNEGNNTCVECNVDADCPGDEPFCADGNTCVECVIDGDCNDGNACTTDACTNGTCGQTPVVCDDGQFCTIDSCDNETGCTTAPNDCGELVCNEGNNTCVECNADGDCPGDEFCTTGNTCVECLTDANCNDNNACTTNDVCVGGSCSHGPPPSCNDSNPCTDDSCSPATGCVYLPNTGPCSDGNACTTGDVCGGGTCQGGTAPNCSDGNPCTADSCNPASGCEHVGSDGSDNSCGQVTNTEFCALPTGLCGTSSTAPQFRLIDLQDPTFSSIQNKTVMNDYIINASNPGQFYYNVFYSGTPGSAVNLTIEVSYPFVTQGAHPIQVHDSVGSSGGCYVPSPSLSGFTITTDGGQTSGSGFPVIPRSDYGAQQLGSTTAVYVSGLVPSTGLVYVTIHLDYGLEKVTGWQQAPNGTTAQGPDTNLDNVLDGLGDGPIYIQSPQPYVFGFSAGGPTHTYTPSSCNAFKKNPGVNGNALKLATGSPVQGVRVQFLRPNGQVIATTTTDADGFYSFVYKHTGKAANYIVKLPDLGKQKTVSLKANGFARANFEDLP